MIINSCTIQRINIEPTKLASIRAPGENRVSRPTSRRVFTRCDTANNLLPQKSHHPFRNTLNRLLVAPIRGRGNFYDISELREAIETPRVDFTRLGKNESVVLAERNTLNCDVQGG